MARLVLPGMLLMALASPLPAQDRGSSTAADSASASARVLRDFSTCRQIADASARLACFDKASAALEAAVTSKEVRIVDKADVRKARRSLFGFSLPRIGLLGTDSADREEPEFTEINTTIRSVRSIASNRVEITLADDNAAVWQTTDPVNFPPRPGSAIRIRKGALGNYFLAMGGRSYRGSRVR